MNIYLIIVLTIYVSFFLLDSIADYLNLKNISSELPPEFVGFYNQEKYKKSQDYLKQRTMFGTVNNIFSLMVTLPFILLGGFNWIDLFVRGFGYSELINGLLYFALMILLMTIIGLPFSFYSTFVIEKKYEFNQTTYQTFFLDMLKQLMLTTLIGGPLLFGILWFFSSYDINLAWKIVLVFIILVQLILTYIAPWLIMPIFNKFEPLKDTVLKDKIFDYSRSQNFSLSGVFQMDGSKRSSKANAFFTGFGKFRRIVLFDTLISSFNHEELISIFAHEVGHYKKKHILKSMVLSFLSTALMLWLLSFFMMNELLFNAFKMDNISNYASLIFFSFLYTPVSSLISVFGAYISRKHEYEADEFAVTTTADKEIFINALKKLSVDHLSNLTPHPLIVFMSYSHPPVLKRIQYIRSLK
tara:strand:- start:3585 stop:4823 length:1239 start_codon:yes stop_codon:yes gene_type:complete